MIGLLSLEVGPATNVVVAGVSGKIKSSELESENSPGGYWNRRVPDTLTIGQGDGDGSPGGMDAHSGVTSVGDVPERHCATVGTGSQDGAQVFAWSAGQLRPSSAAAREARAV